MSGKIIWEMSLYETSKFMEKTPEMSSIRHKLQDIGMDNMYGKLSIEDGTVTIKCEKEIKLPLRFIKQVKEILIKEYSKPSDKN